VDTISIATSDCLKKSSPLVIRTKVLCNVPSQKFDLTTCSSMLDNSCESSWIFLGSVWALSSVWTVARRRKNEPTLLSCVQWMAKDGPKAVYLSSIFRVLRLNKKGHNRGKVVAQSGNVPLTTLSGSSSW